MTDTPAPLSADSLPDDRIAEPSWIGIVAKIGLAYIGEVSDEASNELIEDAEEDFEALLAAQKQRWSDDTRAKFPDKINFGGLSSDLAKHTDMWKGGEQFGFNKAVDLCIAALDSVIGEQQT